jgi:hypothetical protein
VQTILALYIYGNETTVKAMAGVFLVVFGSAAYAYVRMREDQEVERPALVLRFSFPSPAVCSQWLLRFCCVVRQAQAAKAKQPAATAGAYRPVATTEVSIAHRAALERSPGAAVDVPLAADCQAVEMGQRKEGGPPVVSAASEEDEV